METENGVVMIDILDRFWDLLETCTWSHLWYESHFIMKKKLCTIQSLNKKSF